MRKKIISILVALFILINSISAAMIIGNPAPSEYYPRPKADFGTVPINFGVNSEDLGYIDDSQISLYWFIHITDVHIRANLDAPHTAAFREFLNYSYYQISPFSVLNTGDLIMGQWSDSFTSLQDKALTEWGIYYSIVNASPYALDPNPYRYLETPGNHDRNVDWGAKAYLNYTLTGNRLGSIQSFFTANFSRGSVAFSLLDSTPWNAPPIFFGSEGHLDGEDLDEYHRFLEENKGCVNKFTFFHHPAEEAFGMSPTSVSPMPKTLMGLNSEYGVDISFYGHSHFHSLETFGQSAYMMGDAFKFNKKFVEYNLSKEHSYHIVSVDNGGINFINVPITADPQIIITNPTNPVFLTDRSPSKNTRGDGNVRTLIFTKENDTVDKVEYRLDNNEWQPMNPYNGTSKRLWESPRTLQSAIPDDGQNHKITVRVTMKNGDVYYESAEATSQRKVKMIWELVLIITIISAMGICLFKNRDNLPLMRSDNVRRRLTKEEKNAKRARIAKENQIPALVFHLVYAIIICTFVLPWGIYPLFQGGNVMVFSTGAILSVRGFDWLSEAFLFTCPILILGIPLMLDGIRYNRPDNAWFGALAVLVNSAFMVFYSYDSFEIITFTPGLFVNIVLSLLVLVFVFPFGYTGKKIAAIREKKRNAQPDGSES